MANLEELKERMYAAQKEYRKAAAKYYIADTREKLKDRGIVTECLLHRGNKVYPAILESIEYESGRVRLLVKVKQTGKIHAVNEYGVEPVKSKE